MSTSLIHFLTVIGKSAAEVEVACEELLGRQVERQDGGFGSENWSEADHRAIESFCLSLIKAATNLPILYYCQYLDGWNTADQRFHRLNWPDGKRRQICADSFGLAFYPSKFCPELLAQIKSIRRQKSYREQSENRWFIDQMREALQSSLWLEAPFLVVSISQGLGPSRHNDEIQAALDLSMSAQR